MKIISNREIAQLLSYNVLIKSLKKAFTEDITVPKRQHLDFPNPAVDQKSTLLLMPAWDDGHFLGVKSVTVSPQNGKFDMPAIQGSYQLFDIKNGMPLALMDAKFLTVMRTAAASALASSFLSREDSQTLLMIGTGALAPELIKAHCTVRPIKKVLIWGRNLGKAQSLSNMISSVECEAVPDIKEVIQEADIVSCATLSREPLVFGEWLRDGQHLDMVGAYRPDMREADDKAILSSEIYVDTWQGVHESGDIAVPMEKGIIRKNSIKGDLKDLCSGESGGRQNNKSITFFKSVGHALEDLVAAKEIWKILNN